MTPFTKRIGRPNRKMEHGDTTTKDFGIKKPYIFAEGREEFWETERFKDNRDLNKKEGRGIYSEESPERFCRVGELGISLSYISPRVKKTGKEGNQPPKKRIFAAGASVR